MPALPAAPVLGYSFTSFSTNYPSLQQPGVYIDAEFNRTNAAVGQIITFLGGSLNADGSLNTAAVQTAYASGTGGSQGTNLADAPSAASAALAQAWAEYMPGELPAATLATGGITGDHWSARWWANQALLAASHVANALTAKNQQTGLVGITYPIDGSGQMTNDGHGNLTWVPCVPIIGGTMTGPLILPANPTLALAAAPKQYVDTETTRATAAEGVLTTAVTAAQATATAALTGAITAQGSAGTANTTANTASTTATAANTAAAAAVVTANAASAAATAATTASTAATTAATAAATAAAAALPLAGGTLTGPLVLAANPTVALQAAPKQYVDTTVASVSAAAAATVANGVAASIAANTGRNRIDNPGFEIIQRGPGPFAIAAGATLYTADRWLVSASGFAASASVGVIAGYRARRALTISGTLSAGNSVSALHRMEAANSYDLAGGIVTASFDSQYAVSAGATTFAAALYYANATDNFSATTLIQSIPFVPTGSPAPYSVTFAALPANAANGLELVITATQTTAAGTLSWVVTAVQLELAPAATALERPCLSEQLRRCQYRFRSSYPPGVAPGTAYAAYAGAVFLTSPGSPSGGHVDFAPMGGTPTIVTYDTAGTAGKVSNSTSWTAGSALTSLTANPAGFNFYASGISSPGFNYTASAEL